MTSQLSNILNTLIILVAVYAGGASACSFINEAIAGALQLRGSTLYRGLVDLLCGAREMVDELYTHPLVYPGNADETPKYNLSNRLWAFLGAENNWPSYLDARNFSVAFWQTLQKRLGADAGATPANAASTPAAACRRSPSARKRHRSLDPGHRAAEADLDGDAGERRKRLRAASDADGCMVQPSNGSNQRLVSPDVPMDTAGVRPSVEFRSERRHDSHRAIL